MIGKWVGVVDFEGKKTRKEFIKKDELIESKKKKMAS